MPMRMNQKPPMNDPLKISRNPSAMRPNAKATPTRLAM
jgi:hypothetical protein